VWNIFSAVVELHYASMFYNKNPDFVGPRNEITNEEERPTLLSLFDVYYESSLFLPALSSSLIFCSILTNFSYIFKAWLIYNGSKAKQQMYFQCFKFLLELLVVEKRLK